MGEAGQQIVARVYRQLAQRGTVIGLEAVDFGLVGGLCWLLLILGVGLGWVFCWAAFGYVAVRLVKAGKPAGYTKDILRYSLFSRRRSYLAASVLDATGQSHPFPH